MIFIAKKIAKFMYQYVHKMLSVHFNNYFTVTDIHSHSIRNQSSNSLTVLRFSTSRSRKSFKYQYMEWNTSTSLSYYLSVNLKSNLKFSF